MKIKPGPAFSLLLASALFAGAAQARSIYCCKDDRGIDACSDILPQACYGRAYREINEHGMTVRRFDAPLTAEQRAQKEAAKKKAQEEERKRMEQERRNRALLATYASEKDIDYMRDGAVAELEKTILLSQERRNEAACKLKKLNEDAEFYKKKGLPPEMRAALRDNENEMKAQETIIEAKKREMAEIKAKYEDDRNRFRELTGGKKYSGPAGSPQR